MKSERIITSNRGFFKYKLTPTGFVVMPKYRYQPVYAIDRTNIRRIFERAGEEIVVLVLHRNRQYSMYARLFGDRGGRSLRIGCRFFNKSTTRLLKKWCGL